ncbi:hypothetical protein [Streptomyces sp. NPDC056105]
MTAREDRSGDQAEPGRSECGVAGRPWASEHWSTPAEPDIAT